MRKFFLWLNSLDVWIIGLCTIAGFISQRFYLLAVICIVVFGFLRWFTRGYLSIRTPVDLPIILLTMMLPVTLWVTGAMMVTLPQVLRLLTGIGLFYTIVNWTNSNFRLRWLVRGVWCAGLFLAFYAFISVHWNSTKLNFIPASLYNHFPLLASDPANPNVMAGTLTILFPCALGVLWYCGIRLGWIDFGLLCLSVIVVMPVIILTQSRGGILALGETMLLLIVLRWKRGWWFLVGVALIFGVVILLLGPRPIINGIFANPSLGGLDGRQELWSRAIYMIQDFPFTGVGMGTYVRVAKLLYPFFQYAGSDPIHTHNLLLQIAVDLGIPGLIAWLAIWILIILMAYQLYQRGRVLQDNWISGLGAGLISSQIALVSHGMLDATTWGLVKPAPLVWLVWGITVSGWYIYHRQK
jgi:putative inorganic carbon (hco3(-)) transporter